MTPEDMRKLVGEHIEAEIAANNAGAVVMYTDDVIHDVVGSPTGPLVGPAAAQGFYDYLSSTITDVDMAEQRSWYGDDFCVAEHLCTATVAGEFAGVPGNGKRIDFRLLHVWEFKDGKISRENVWMDGATVVAKLTGQVPA